MSTPIPIFTSEQEEQDFWSDADSASHVDWSGARRVVMPRLKPTTRTISLRLPEHLVDSLKVLANKRDVPYQSLLKLFLSERVEAELKASQGTEPRRAA